MRLFGIFTECYTKGFRAIRVWDLGFGIGFRISELRFYGQGQDSFGTLSIPIGSIVAPCRGYQQKELQWSL